MKIFFYPTFTLLLSFSISSMISHFEALPKDIQEMIIISIPSSKSTLEDDIKTLMKLRCVNKQFNHDLLHSPQLTNALIHQLAHTHSLPSWQVALFFNTPASRQWCKDEYEKLKDQPHLKNNSEFVHFFSLAVFKFHLIDLLTDTISNNESSSNE